MALFVLFLASLLLLLAVMLVLVLMLPADDVIVLLILLDGIVVVPLMIKIAYNEDRSRNIVMIVMGRFDIFGKKDDIGFNIFMEDWLYYWIFDINYWPNTLI